MAQSLAFFFFSNLLLSLLLLRHVSAVEAGTQCLPMSEQFAYVSCLSQLAEDTYEVTPKDKLPINLQSLNIVVLNQKHHPLISYERG